MDRIQCDNNISASIQRIKIMDFEANPAYSVKTNDPLQTPIYSEINKSGIGNNQSMIVKMTSRKLSWWLVVASIVTLATLVLVLCLGVVVGVLHSTMHDYNQDIQALRTEVERLRNKSETLRLPVNNTSQLNDLQSLVTDFNTTQNLLTSQVGSLRDTVDVLLIDTQTNLTGYITSSVDLYRNCRTENFFCSIRPTTTQQYWRFCSTGLGSTILLVSLYTCT